MSTFALPQGWESDYDGVTGTWFFVHRPSGVKQLDFPKTGDELVQPVELPQPAEAEAEMAQPKPQAQPDALTQKIDAMTISLDAERDQTPAQDYPAAAPEPSLYQQYQAMNPGTWSAKFPTPIQPVGQPGAHVYQQTQPLAQPGTHIYQQNTGSAQSNVSLLPTQAVPVHQQPQQYAPYAPPHVEQHQQQSIQGAPNQGQGMPLQSIQNVPNQSPPLQAQQQARPLSGVQGYSVPQYAPNPQANQTIRRKQPGAPNRQPSVSSQGTQGSPSLQTIHQIPQQNFQASPSSTPQLRQINLPQGTPPGAQAVPHQVQGAVPVDRRQSGQFLPQQQQNMQYENQAPQLVQYQNGQQMPPHQRQASVVSQHQPVQTMAPPQTQHVQQQRPESVMQPQYQMQVGLQSQQPQPPQAQFQAQQQFHQPGQVPNPQQIPHNQAAPPHQNPAPPGNMQGAPGSSALPAPRYCSQTGRLLNPQPPTTTPSPNQASYFPPPPPQQALPGQSNVPAQTAGQPQILANIPQHPVQYTQSQPQTPMSPGGVQGSNLYRAQTGPASSTFSQQPGVPQQQFQQPPNIQTQPIPGYNPSLHGQLTTPTGPPPFQMQSFQKPFTAPPPTATKSAPPKTAAPAARPSLKGDISRFFSSAKKGADSTNSWIRENPKTAATIAGLTSFTLNVSGVPVDLKKATKAIQSAQPKPTHAPTTQGVSAQQQAKAMEAAIQKGIQEGVRQAMLQQQGAHPGVQPGMQYSGQMYPPGQVYVGQRPVMQGQQQRQVHMQQPLGAHPQAHPQSIHPQAHPQIIHPQTYPQTHAHGFHPQGAHSQPHPQNPHPQPHHPQYQQLHHQQQATQAQFQQQQQQQQYQQQQQIQMMSQPDPSLLYTQTPDPSQTTYAQQPQSQPIIDPTSLLSQSTSTQYPPTLDSSSLLAQSTPMQYLPGPPPPVIFDPPATDASASASVQYDFQTQGEANSLSLIDNTSYTVDDTTGGESAYDFQAQDDDSYSVDYDNDNDD